MRPARTWLDVFGDLVVRRFGTRDGSDVLRVANVCWRCNNTRVEPDDGGRCIRCLAGEGEGYTFWHLERWRFFGRVVHRIGGRMSEDQAYRLVEKNDGRPMVDGVISRKELTVGKRRAFTLVELLVVIAIIAILIGLLVPVVWGAFRRGREAQVESQVNLMATGLMNFKTKYGTYPPSRLIVHESGYFGTEPAGNLYYAGHPASVAADPIGGRPIGPEAGTQEWAELVQRSLKALRDLFPKMTNSVGAFGPGRVPLAPTEAGGFYDVNGDRVMQDEPILLDGHECLALFLTGVPDWQPDGNGRLELRGAGGLSSHPGNPFTAVPSSGPDQGSRSAPYFDAPAHQLVDDDGDGVPGIVDTLGDGPNARYFAYFSSDHGGYDPRDVQLEFDPGSDQLFTLPRFGTLSVPGPNPWTVGPSSSLSAARYVRADTYQILSAGTDRKYGPGGEVEVIDGVREYPGGDRKAEMDNIGMR